MDTTEFDLQTHLKTEEDFRLFLEASFAEDPGDGSGIRLALREIAKARGVYSVAKESGLPRREFISRWEKTATLLLKLS